MKPEWVHRDFQEKTLADISGRPSIEWVFKRLERCKHLDGTILATTISPGDDVLEEWAGKAGVNCYRGSEEDVLIRVVEAQRKMSSDIVVEVTGDSILLDPEVIDQGIETFLNNKCDIVTNCLKTSYPQGVDVQVFSLDKLEEVEATINDEAVREHVSLYFYEHPEIYSVFNIFAPARWKFPQYRFQLDYKEDYEFLKAVYSKLLPVHGESFGTEEVLALLKKEPELVKINSDCVKSNPRD